MTAGTIFDGGTLFGFPHSYYTVIAVSYLRKQGAVYDAASARHPSFEQEIVPQIGRRIVPVFRLSDGTVVQDSLDIIELGEANTPRLPATPSDLRQRLLSALFFTYGSQALLKPAMHYRWSFYEQQSAFLDHAFGLTGGGEQAGKVMDKMRSYLPGLGVTPETIPTVEAHFEALLKALDAHFAKSAFLFGGQPSVGDYGMFGPLFAHLGRDPVPETLMKKIAPNVFAWIERMYSPLPDTYDIKGPSGFYEDGQLPDSLVDVLKVIGAEYGPELTDRLDFLAGHIEQTAPKPGDPVSERPSQRMVGMTPVRYGDARPTVAVQPYLLYCINRVRDAFAKMGQDDQAWASQFLSQFGLNAAIDHPLPMTVGRANHIEVWEAN